MMEVSVNRQAAAKNTQVIDTQVNGDRNPGEILIHTKADKKQIRDPSVHIHLNVTDLGRDGRGRHRNHRKQRDCAGRGSLRTVYWCEIFPFSVALWFSQQTCNFFKPSERKVGINLGHLGCPASRSSPPWWEITVRWPRSQCATSQSSLLFRVSYIWNPSWVRAVDMWIGAFPSIQNSLTRMPQRLIESLPSVWLVTVDFCRSYDLLCY